MGPKKRLKRQFLYKKISPREASIRRLSARKARILTTSGVNKLCSESGNYAYILLSDEK